MGRIIERKLNMKKIFTLSLLALIGCGGTSEQTVVVDGSSTVFRISKAAQSEFQKTNPEVDVIVESHGTGGGFGRYLAGEVDIVDASREAKDEEVKSAVGDLGWTKHLVAYDGITVVVNPANDFVNELTTDQLKKIWESGSKVSTWKDVNPAWPDRKINFFSPDKDSGTFEFFTEAINHKSRSQRDGVQVSPDDNALVRGVAGDKDSLGYFGYAYYTSNNNKLKAVKVNGVEPSKESIKSGKYPALTRPLFIYVKNKAMERPEVKSFVEYYLKNVGELSEKSGYVSP